jgi:DNA-damage-inducible protein D
MNDKFHSLPDTRIAVFKGKEIRKTIYNNEWWFSIADVISVLTESADARQYIKKMRQRDPQLDSYWGTICTPLELLAPDGSAGLTTATGSKPALSLPALSY